MIKFTVLLLLLSPFARASEEERSYKVFALADLGRGKSVTLGRAVHAYAELEESVVLQGANPPQQVEVRLLGENDLPVAVPIYPRWLADKHIIIVQGVPALPQGPMQRLFVRDANNSARFSFSLTAGESVTLQADKAAFKQIKGAKLVISSSEAFEVQR